MESVWDYPRPPALEPERRRVRVVFAGETIADSLAALRILETSHPPTIYLPPNDVTLERFTPTSRASVCEWKGTARYLDLEVGDHREASVAWTYPRPVERYAALRDHVALYPGRMDACWLGEERVLSQEGDFYGGWITSELEGPFKGGRGTRGW